MATSLTATLSTGVKTFTEMSAGRQLALIGMIAGGLVTAAAILFWAFKPTYAPLFGQMDSAEASEVMQALSQMAVPYKVDNLTGRIEIPQQKIAETRLLLAGQGLPKSADIGFELLQQDAGFGTSRLIEGARYQRALEGELGRSIAALDPVESARVHLAKAERSVFVRERTPPSASVIVQLKGSRSLSDAQVGAIVHLVSSSIPDLSPDRVTVVDQTGRLLTQDDDDKAGNNLSLDSLDYIARVESSYVNRVQSLLAPIVGRDRVRVQVAADLDFSRVERTQETFDPDRTAVRSEQTNEEERIGADPGAGGIPGALTNQPPQGGAVGERTEAAGASLVPSSRSQQTTRNYEVDRTIAHVQETPGGIRRLTTAVVVDYQDQINDAGEPVRVPRAEAEMETIRALVREAVGFSEARGDSIRVSSASFVQDALDEEVAPVWTQPWFLELAKILAGFTMALLVILLVVRPGIRQLAPQPPEPEEQAALESDGDEEQLALTDESGGAAHGEDGDDVVALSHQPSALGALMGPKGPDQQQMDLDAVRAMVKEDPKRVAQVMKSWLAEDGN
ncbi:flagellar M-ring protein FliF [Thiorhodococcus mannitoliphagus]|uniref:Flagellar M-ring protein n=1 Tax=Thiorhodococcus mannitoliphagus TaxID=329406 RepID=A0A6P1DTU8_9GAMM|nr:flagellar basal-body MS-ring/collar protein FliF [Thiorhodococcus mannitoliphagus]NEX20116.1 flagellar M-ring protein FliF [Thiorhodococcus mannitoliphagus]